MADAAALPPGRTSLKVKLLVLTLTVGLSLLALEAGLRLFWHPPARFMGGEVRGSNIFLPDPRLGWKMAPNGRIDFEWRWGGSSTIRTNSFGFRDVDHVRDHAEGVPRVIVLGDSHAFGYGIAEEETFTARLRTLLPGVEFLNLAETGYNTRQERALFEDEGAAFRPDVVILAFSQNDVTTQCIPAAEFVTDKGCPDPWLVRNVYVLAFLREKVNSSRGLVRLCVRLGIKDELGGYELLDTNARPSLREYPPELVRQWDETRDELRRLRDACTAGGARLLLLSIPMRQAVDTSRLESGLAHLDYDPEDFDLEKPYRMLREFCEAEGIAFADAYPPLRESQRRGDPPFLEHDIHVNATGHRIMAELLAPRLAEMLPRK